MARFVILIQSGDPKLIEDLAHRFDLEFVLAGQPPPVDLPPDGSIQSRRLAFRETSKADQLASAQAHAIRVESLYPKPKNRGELEITLGYVDDFKVVRAVRANGADRIELGQGVWAEIVLRRDPGARFTPSPSGDSEWTGPEAVAFFNSLK